MSVKHATNNKIMSGCDEGSIKIWDIETSECLKTINVHSSTISNIVLISNERFVTCSLDSTIKLFDRIFIGHGNFSVVY